VSPAVSIVVPTRNRRASLRAALEALLPKDGGGDVELLVVDDGSSDGTAADLAALAETGRIVHLQSDGVGPAAARNAGIARARAPVIALTDDDCVVPPGWALGLAQRLLATGAAAVGGRVVAAAEADRPDRLCQAITNGFLFAFDRDAVDAVFLTSNNVAYRADALREVGGFDHAFRQAGGEERELNARLLARGWRLVYAPDIVVTHRPALTWRGFLAQQFVYGRGARLYYRRERRLAGARPGRLGFPGYLSAFAAAGREVASTDRAALFLALPLSQLAVACGYLRGPAKERALEPAPEKTPRTVLYLTLYGTVGGAERTLLQLVSAVDRTRVAPLVVVGSDGPLVPLLRRSGAEVIVEPFPAPPLHRLVLPRILWQELRAALRLRRLVRERAIHLVHCGDLLGLLLLLPSIAAGTRAVYQISYLGGGLRRLLLNLLALPWVTRIVAYSADQRRLLCDGSVGLAARTSVIHPGIEPSEFRGGDRRRLRAELGVEDGAPLVGLVARYDTWKGHEVFLEAAVRVRAAFPRARFAMIGGDLNAASLPHVVRCRARVLRRLETLELREAVRVVEHRADVPDVLASLDVVVCPSRREPFGLVLVEAMAAGRPVIASDSGGPLEIIEDGRSGLLFPTGDAAVLAERIIRLLGDPRLGASLAEGGRKRVEETFHRSRYAREMEALYDALV
jgi:glycosyltransferase involved in cell wall biosynthesis